jgi:hypothetical protein
MLKDTPENRKMQREIIADANSALGTMTAALINRGGRLLDLRSEKLIRQRPKNCTEKNCVSCLTFLC